MSDQNRIKGELLSTDEDTEFKSLTNHFSIDIANKRIDTFAKWLFTTTTAVGAFAITLFNSEMIKIDENGKFVFGLGIAVIALSLAFAAMCLSPVWVEINHNDPDSMLRGVNQQFRTRKKWTIMASIFFAFGFFFAGLAPIASAILSRFAPKSPPTIKVKQTLVTKTYNLNENGKFVTSLKAIHTAPNSPIELVVASLPINKKAIAPRLFTTSDSLGTASLATDSIDVPSKSESIRIITTWHTNNKKQISDTTTVPLRIKIKQ